MKIYIKKHLRNSSNANHRYTSPDFSYFKSWLPCIFFSGGVTIGKIGRQLAQVARVLFFFRDGVDDNMLYRLCLVNTM